MPSLRRVLHGSGFRCEALLPTLPDCPDNEALERAHRFSSGLAFGHAPRAIRLRLRRMPRLREHDPLADRVETPITTAIETIPHPLGR